MCVAGDVCGGSGTGFISGAVFDSNGGPVAGVVITVSGPQLPRDRTFTTNESGMYQFLRLLPGTYTVEASKPDLGSSKRDIIVELDRDARVDVVLGLAVQETIDVRAERSAVDLARRRSTSTTTRKRSRTFRSRGRTAGCSS